MRLTTRYIKKWLQETFNRLEIDWVVSEMYHTRLPSYMYENGAAVYVIRITQKNNSENTTNILIFDHLKNMQYWMERNNQKLHFVLRDGQYLSDSYITLK